MAYSKKVLTQEDVEAIRVALQFRREKLSMQPSCDFCGGQPPVVIYEATRLSTGQVCDCWRWCACARCEALVDGDKLGDLIEIIVAWMHSKGLRGGVVKDAARASLSEFEKYAKRV